MQPVYSKTHHVYT